MFTEDVRRERLCLFFSFLLLFRPALDGDSSFSLPWLDTLEELWELKCVGTCRANPPCDAKVALQPPTTHCRDSSINQNNPGRRPPAGATPNLLTLKGLSPLWVSMCLCSQL